MKHKEEASDIDDNTIRVEGEAAPSENSQIELTEEQRRIESRRRRTLVISASVLALILILIAFFVWRARNAKATATEETTAVVSVRVAKAERQPIASQVSALGTIFPREQATVSAKVGAQIKQMALLKNRVVRAGEVIATLESRDLQAQRGEAVAALGEARATQRSVTTGTIPQTNAQDEKALSSARAAALNARATYERRLALYNRGGISKKDLETSQLALTTAEEDLRLAQQTVNLRTKAINPNDRALAAARVEQAQQHVGTLDAQLSYATIRAPITGIITDQFQYQGEFAAAGAKLVTISDISQVIVKAPFADNVATQIKVGDAATVFPTDVPGEKMTGNITLISRASDPTNRTVEVWVTLGNEAGRLRSSGAAQVIVSTQAKTDTIVVPSTAVTLDATNANEGAVIIVGADSVAHETKVTIGIRTGELTEIAAGLEGGETVVVEGNYALPDGTKVEINESSKNGAGDAGKDKEAP